jgi:hypothetical protein
LKYDTILLEQKKCFRYRTEGAETVFKEASKETLSRFTLLLPPKGMAISFATSIAGLCEKDTFYRKKLGN